MSYLSRVLINPLRAKGREYLANPQIAHAAVLGGIVSQPVTERVLWRMGHDARGPSGNPIRAELLVLTDTRPSFDHIVEEAGYRGGEGAAPVVRDYSRLLDAVAVGREFAFKVRVNPVQAVRRPKAPSAAQREVAERSDGRHRGFRMAHRTVDQQTGWFLDRCEGRWGFQVPLSVSTGAPDLRVVARDRMDFTKRSGSGGSRRVQVQTATFEGRLRVTDSRMFTEALLGGIGPAKAYGCGLLTLASLVAPDG